MDFENHAACRSSVSMDTRRERDVFRIHAKRHGMDHHGVRFVALGMGCPELVCTDSRRLPRLLVAHASLALVDVVVWIHMGRCLVVPVCVFGGDATANLVHTTIRSILPGLTKANCISSLYAPPGRTQDAAIEGRITAQNLMNQPLVQLQLDENRRRR